MNSDRLEGAAKANLVVTVGVEIMAEAKPMPKSQVLKAVATLFLRCMRLNFGSN